jgi:hypothetical protein
MNLPASFKKIENSSYNTPSTEPKQANAGNKEEGNSGNRKKRKNKTRNGNQVKNSAQDEDFMVAECSRPFCPKLEIQHDKKRKRSMPTLTREE